MLRQTPLKLHYQFDVEFWRARPLLRGRQKSEKKFGVRAVALRLQRQTRFRLLHRKYDQRARVRANVDSAAGEHGTGWSHIRNDVSRHNLALLPTTQRLLAQYEPLAFKSLIELCKSGIAPPPTIESARPHIPTTAMKKQKVEQDKTKESTPASDAYLRELLTDVFTADASVARTSGNSNSALQKLKVNGATVFDHKIGSSTGAATAAWMDAWKDFQTIDPKVRAQPTN